VNDRREPDGWNEQPKQREKDTNDRNQQDRAEIDSSIGYAVEHDESQAWEKQAQQRGDDWFHVSLLNPTRKLPLYGSGIKQIYHAWVKFHLWCSYTNNAQNWCTA